MRKPVVIFLGISGVGIVIVIVAALIVFFTYTLDTFKSPSLLRPPCDSKIFCYGDFLMHAQIWADGRDSKQLVDLAMKEDEQVIVEKFEDLLKGDFTNADIIDFVNTNFIEDFGVEEWIPPDFKEDPTFLSHIQNDEVREFATGVVQKWNLLGKKVKDIVRQHQSRYSLIPVPNGFIVPGGRFQEYYYWDSYWSIEGLLISEMTDTARGMIENFLDIVDRYGHMPNGGRVYYLERSQPPLLSFMAKLYYDYTNDVNWLEKHVEMLETELQFWMKRIRKITVGDKIYNAATYNARSYGPRPESYKEDYQLAQASAFKDNPDPLYIELKSAAESGWDFSSRWIIGEDGSNQGKLYQTNITRIIPVDLNAFLYGAFNIVGDFYGILNQEDKQTYWHEQAQIIYETIDELLWNQDDGIWYDYDFALQQHRKYFAASNLAPLWTKAYNTNTENTISLIDSVVDYLQRENIMDYQGGVPVTTEQSAEQWDFPNVWAPLQSIVVEGLENSGTARGKLWARTFAERFVNSVQLRYILDGDLYEKYDAVTPGDYGGGGEYETVVGFGWTNGVTLKFITQYFSSDSTISIQKHHSGGVD